MPSGAGEAGRECPRGTPLRVPEKLSALRVGVCLADGARLPVVGGCRSRDYQVNEARWDGNLWKTCFLGLGPRHLARRSEVADSRGMSSEGTRGFGGVPGTEKEPQLTVTRLELRRAGRARVWGRAGSPPSCLGRG